jgi:CBS domain-containing protein
VKEFIDFLGSQPPYDSLDAADLQTLAATVEVEYFVRGTMIVTAKDKRLDHLYVIRAGEVQILDQGRIIDVLGPGETVGHLSVLSGMPPPLSAQATEDTLCYRIPDPRGIVQHLERLRFAYYGSVATRDRLMRSGLASEALRPVRQKMRPPVWCSAGTSIQDAAKEITEASSSFALVNRAGSVGIVTDNDFRRAVAEGRAQPGAPVASIASFPAKTISAETLVSDALLDMVETGVHHLVVTGTSNMPVGVLRVVDVASAEVRSPLVLRTAIAGSETIDQLARVGKRLPDAFVELYDTGVSTMHIASLISALTDALMGRVLHLTGIETGPPPGETSWLLLWSLARREPLPQSDVDTGLVWDMANGTDTVLIRGWAARVLDNMERCGLQRCVEGANATNPLFGRSRSSAIAAATSWISNPNQEKALLMASMIADSRPISGIALGRSVSDAMLATTRGRTFLSLLLKFTLARRPPVGFVRGFVVEHSGAHKGRLDLKADGLVPIASLGRWIAIVTGDDRGSTISRLRRGNAQGLLTDDETETLVRGFEYIYGLILRHEVDAIRESRTATTWIDPKHLDTLTRRYLREAFRAVAQVQGRLEGDWISRLG